MTWQSAQAPHQASGMDLRAKDPRMADCPEGARAEDLLQDRREEDHLHGHQAEDPQAEDPRQTARRRTPR